MKNSRIQKEYIDIIAKSQKEFEKELKNKKIIFIYENKDRTIGNEEMFFPITCFYHLTGIKAFDSKNKLLNSYKFYKLLQKGGIDESKIEIKDTTTYFKLQVLPQLMKIDKSVSMIGTFFEHGLILQTNKIVGNVNACLGFIKNQETNLYIPNTALKKDIRDITSDRKKIIAVAKKNLNEKLYKNITYLKQSYDICNILESDAVKGKIDMNNVYSENCKIDRIIKEKI